MINRKNTLSAIFSLSLLSFSLITHADEMSIANSRYVDIQVGASASQINLLNSIIDINAPDSIVSIGEAIEYFLHAYGFHLTEGDDYPEQAILFNLPLPQPHRYLGPISLGEALSVLGGEGFDVIVNPVTRSIAFQIKENHQQFIDRGDISEAQTIWGSRNVFVEELPLVIDEEIAPIVVQQQYGPVKPGEILSSITESIGLNGVTLSQRMLGLFMANPHAFGNQNMNTLYADVMLFIPDSATAENLTDSQARAIVLEQYQTWEIQGEQK